MNSRSSLLFFFMSRFDSISDGVCCSQVCPPRFKRPTLTFILRFRTLEALVILSSALSFFSAQQEQTGTGGITATSAMLPLAVLPCLGMPVDNSGCML